RGTGDPLSGRGENARRCRRSASFAIVPVGFGFIAPTAPPVCTALRRHLHHSSSAGAPRHRATYYGNPPDALDAATGRNADVAELAGLDRRRGTVPGRAARVRFLLRLMVQTYSTHTPTPTQPR